MEVASAYTQRKQRTARGAHLARFIALICVAVSSGVHAAPQSPFRVEVIDSENLWPVPLVELRTTGEIRFVTDNAGNIAIDAPELFDRETWFFVIADGYQAPADGFGYRGVRLVPRRGESGQVKVERTSIAKRLGRVTGAGMFADSQRLGLEMNWLESGVVGCDSVQNAVHNGRLFWIWGDTSLFHYPLGVFHASGAWTPVRPIDSFEPPIRISYDLMRDGSGRPRGVAEMPGAGPTWLTGLASLPDADGEEHLVAFYSRIRPPMIVYEWGLCEWSELRQSFERVQVRWTEPISDGGRPLSGESQAAMSPTVPEGHATLWTGEAGVVWVLFGNPFPTVRCRATYESWRDMSTYEWIEAPAQVKVVAAVPDAPPRFVTPHSGSIAWHPWRSRWVTVFVEKWGTPSAFGEVWYAESDSPLGPWGSALKVLSHANYTFYNPRVHSEWFDDESPSLVFEGTYSRSFANRPEATPRYDYNQVMYRLDLDDPALQAPRRPDE